MLRQIQKLTALQICNLFGINEIRFTKDTSKKTRSFWMFLVGILITAILVFYVALLSFGLAAIGMPEIIPTYLYMITSLVILIFSFLKAASVIFQMKSFEMLAALPLSKSAIIISRFLTMYISNLGISFLVMAAGTIVYGITAHPAPAFYILCLIGVLFLPLLPMTISTAIGALITGIGSRMKHKNLATAGFTIVFAMIIVIASFSLSSQADQLSITAFQNLAAIITLQIRRIYPPAIWFGNAVISGNILSLSILIGFSVLIFTLLVFIVQKTFMSICQALNTTSAKSNYKLQSLTASPVLKALWHRELKHYFASSIYVTNTLICYILMILIPIALLITDTEKLELALGLPGIIQRAMPVFLGITAAIMPMTACSISMEGKNWWLVQTLPIKPKTLLNAKILAHLSVVAPFYLTSVILSIIALGPDGLNIFWLITVPAAYILFSSVAGIAVNLQFPVFNWENETRVVKQSASILITMLVDFIAALPPILCLLMIKTLPASAIFGPTLILLLIFSLFLYQSCIKKPILNMN